jgi:hypothetical protein
MGQGMKDQAAEATITAAALKTAPMVAVAGASVAGWGVQEWMYAGTLGYIVLQGLYLLWKWHREWRKDRDGR